MKGLGTQQLPGQSSAHRKLQLVMPRSDEREPVSSGPTHVNIVGYPGTYKSTVAQILAGLYITTWISRYNTRPARQGEENGKEYIFITNEEYRELYNNGKILKFKEDLEHTVNTDGSEYVRGIPVYEDWPTPVVGTQLVLSVFDPFSSPEIQRILVPDMINICLTGSNIVLLDRVRKRKSLDAIGGHLKHVQRFREAQIERNFDHVIVTDDKTSMEVMNQIIDIARLPRHWENQAVSP